MKGRKLPMQVFGRLPDKYSEGDYWQVGDGNDPQAPLYVNEETNLTKTVWMVVTPLNQIGTLRKHTVREEDDGTISVRPGDGSSNSILITDHRGTWHGYIEHGEWRPI